MHFKNISHPHAVKYAVTVLILIGLGIESNDLEMTSCIFSLYDQGSEVPRTRFSIVSSSAVFSTVQI